MILDLVDFEKNNTPGMPIDIVIVNSEIGSPYDTEILQFDGMKIGEGTLFVRNRENIGWSFGSYDYAFKNFDYQEWLFTEHDIFVGGKDYYKVLKDLFAQYRKERHCGFIGLINTTTGRGRHPLHCSGGVGYTEKDILQKLSEKCGGIPHYKASAVVCEKEKIEAIRGKGVEIGDELYTEKVAVIHQGEIAFTGEIHGLGYSLETISKGKWGFENNFSLPYFDYRLLKTVEKDEKQESLK